MSQVSQILRELKDDKQVGDAAIYEARFNYNDLYAIFGHIGGEKIRTRIYSEAEELVKNSSVRNGYRNRIQPAKKQDLKKLEGENVPKLTKIDKNIEKLETEIAEAKGYEITVLEIIDNYEKRIKTKKEYIQEQENRRDEAQRKSDEIISKIDLNETDEIYLRNLRDRTIQYQLKHRNRIAKYLNVQPEPLPDDQSPFSDTPEYEGINKKIIRKDNTLSRYDKRIDGLTSRVDVYKTQLTNLEKERDDRIERTREEAIKSIEENTRMIGELGGEYDALDGSYQISFEEIDSLSIDAEKDTDERFLEFHLRELAQKEINDELVRRETKALTKTSD